MAKLLSLPKEGGVYGVWLASLLYALPSILKADIELTAPGLLGSVFALLTLNYIRYSKGLWKYAIFIGVSSLYAPILTKSLPWSVLAIAAALPLLYYSLKGGMKGVIAGGGLISLHGSVLYMAGSTPGLAFIPGVYGLLATSQAGVRVSREISGRVMVARAFEIPSLILMTAYIIALFAYDYILPAVILAVDLVVRLIGEVSGFHWRLQLKKYGILEFARSSMVMAMVSWALE